MKSMKSVKLVGGAMVMVVIGGCAPSIKADSSPPVAVDASAAVHHDLERAPAARSLGSEARRDADDPAITVASTLVSSTVRVTVTGAGGVSCTPVGEDFCCKATAGTIAVTWSNIGAFLYVHNDGSGKVSDTPPSSVEVSATVKPVVDFGVVAASPTGSELDWLDPKITVQTGTCSGGDTPPE